MPKGSEARTCARKAEIVDACAALYETVSFRDITLRDIGARTSFTRTSIYNYFQTKEEIFLALLQREYAAWTADLEALLRQPGPMTAAAFAEALAGTLGKRRTMLKLMSMNLYDLEDNSRLENLVEFKTVYAGTTAAITRCLERFFPSLGQEGNEAFLCAFLPFLFGVYPHTEPTEKQRRAMELAHVPYVRRTVAEITRSLVEKLLQDVPPADA